MNPRKLHFLHARRRLFNDKTGTKMADETSQEAALRKLRSTPVVRSKEPMAAEMRMEMIELVQTNVDKVSVSFSCFDKFHNLNFFFFF